MKRTFSTGLAYVFGIVFIAWGVVLMEKADFGVSVEVAPAYLFRYTLGCIRKLATHPGNGPFRTVLRHFSLKYVSIPA